MGKITIFFPIFQLFIEIYIFFLFQFLVFPYHHSFLHIPAREATSQTTLQPSADMPPPPATDAGTNRTD